jgi:ribosomal protein S18 acetylase RimI-like enzyme
MTSLHEINKHHIAELDAAGLERHLEALAEVLHDCVQHGASVGFVLPYTLAEARSFWQGVLAQWQGGLRRLFVLYDGDGGEHVQGDPVVLGTAQLVLTPLANGSHRAEVSKVLVHSRARRRGCGRALMLAAEDCARALGLSLLVLDTRSGDAGEHLYGTLGFQAAGRIPGYARASDGGFDATTYMYKHLAPLPEPHARMTVAAEDPTTADAAALMSELSATLALITGDSGNSSFQVEDVLGAAACFSVARDRMGIALGCGAFRPLQDGVAEVKRMLSRPGNPGTGSAILAFLEARARQMGYRELWLETRIVNTRAVQFYEARGYRRRENFGKYAGNPAAICFEKSLLDC